jgi:hypothetical protein
MDGLDYTAIIEFAEPFARRRGFGSLGRFDYAIFLKRIYVFLVHCGRHISFLLVYSEVIERRKSQNTVWRSFPANRTG